MINKILKILKKVFEEFSVSFYCKNCYKRSTFRFPEGTSIIRAPYLGYDNAQTRVIIRHPGKASEHKTIKCPHCKIGNVA